MVKSMSIEEFCSSEQELKDMFADDWKILLTTDGKPAGIVIDIHEQDLETTIRDIQIVRAKRAIASIQAYAVKAGLDKLTLEEINELIAEGRGESKFNEESL
jgi:hypothetical protein